MKKLLPSLLLAFACIAALPAQAGLFDKDPADAAAAADVAITMLADGEEATSSASAAVRRAR